MRSTSTSKDMTQYIGNELEIFNHAQNWKKYWGNQIKPFLGKRILEVGAGIGGTTNALLKQNLAFDKWVCIEPDPNLSLSIKDSIQGIDYGNKIEIFTGFLADYKIQGSFDSILYIDVIEHIEHEKSELERAVAFLRKGGNLIIIVPAHQFLFSEFDKAIGHFRRYDRESLEKVIPPHTVIVRNRYLDSFGLFASLVNKLFLKQSYPTVKQVKFWDTAIVPLSKIIDRLVLFNFGKSIVLIAEKQ